jgi:hypothetical protein
MDKNRRLKPDLKPASVILAGSTLRADAAHAL